MSDSYATFKNKTAKLEQQLKNYLNRVENLTHQELKDMAQEVLDNSLEIVPVDTGALKASAYIEDKSEGTQLKFEIGYDKNNELGYAAYVHENLQTGEDYKNPTTIGTHWQFLSQPFEMLINDIPRRLAKRIKEA